MQLSDGEKLIAAMLADIMQEQGISGEIDPGFVKQALGGDLWALGWQYHGLFTGEEPSEAAIEETASILNMCRVVEDSIEALAPAEKAQITPGDRKLFVGFDGNADLHFGIATMFIEHLNRWTEFKERPLNSHSLVLPAYRRQRAVYEAQGGATSSPLPLSSIQKIIAA